MNKILFFLLDYDLKITKDDLWDYCQEVNIYNDIEIVKCKKYEEIIKKLENVNVYDYEALYFEITEKCIKMKCVYTSIYRYCPLNSLDDIASQLVYYKTVGFDVSNCLQRTEIDLGRFVSETEIYENGSEYEAYRKQMKINTDRFLFFIYKNKIKTTALDINFSIEFKDINECMKYIEYIDNVKYEDIENIENERIKKLRKSRIAVDIDKLFYS